MVGSQDTGTVGEDLFVQGDGFVESSYFLVSASEVIAEGESAWVVGSQNTFGILEVLFILSDCLLESTHLLLSAGEIIA